MQEFRDIRWIIFFKTSPSCANLFYFNRTNQWKLPIGGFEEDNRIASVFLQAYPG
jgi:hypothetical protein